MQPLIPVRWTRQPELDGNRRDLQGDRGGIERRRSPFLAPLGEGEGRGGYFRPASSALMRERSSPSSYHIMAPHSFFDLMYAAFCVKTHGSSKVQKLLPS